MVGFDPTPANDWERTLLACAMADSPAAFAAKDGEPQASLRAAFLRHLLLGRPAAEGWREPWPQGPAAVHVTGARIDGPLDLADRTGPAGAALPPLCLEDCELPDEIDLSNARLARFSISGSRFTKITARRLRLDGNFDFSRARGLGPPPAGEKDAVGWIDAHGARIAGDVEGRGARLRAPEPREPKDIPAGTQQYALRLSNCDIGGRVTLLDDFRGHGGVIFSDGDFRGEVWLSGATVSAAEGDALEARNANFRSILMLDDGFTAHGRVRLLGAKIAGNLECDNATFNNKTEDDSGIALLADNASIGGAMFLRGEKFNASGRISLSGAKIAGNLECDNATFNNKTEDGSGTALVVENASIDGAVLLRGEKFNSSGRITLLGTKIAGNLDCDNATFNNKTEDGSGIALLAVNGTIGGAVLLRGEKFNASGRITLLGAKIAGNLACDNATFNNKTSDGSGTALVVENASVGGDAFLRGEKFNASGRINLSGAKIAGNLECDNATFNNKTEDGSGIALLAENASVDGAVFLRGEKFNASGLISLSGAKIAGSLDCVDATFNNKTEDGSGIALLAENASVDGAVFLRGEKFNASGLISLSGAKIAGSLDCVDATFNNKTEDGGGMALGVGNTTVGGDAFLRGEKFNASGRINLSGAKIAGSLECDNATFNNKTTDGGGMALLIENASVGGGVLLRGEKFNASGRISLLGAKIAGNLDCCDAKFENPRGQTLCTDNAEIGLDFLSRNATSVGAMRCWGTKVGADLVLEGAQLIGPLGTAIFGPNLCVGGDFNLRGTVFIGEIRLEHLDVTGSLDWRGASAPMEHALPSQTYQSSPLGMKLALKNAVIRTELRALALMTKVRLDIDLGGAHAATLIDEETDSNRSYVNWRNGWGGRAAIAANHVTINLDGFVYDRMVIPKSRRAFYAGDRIKWLALQRDGFYPQPYRQLAKALRTHGREEAARKVAIAEARRRAFGSWLSPIVVPFFGWPFGYGLSPTRAAITLFLFVAIGWWGTQIALSINGPPALVLTTAPVASILSPAPNPPREAIERGAANLATIETACGDQISPPFYAIDLMLPVIPLHQESRCDISILPQFWWWRVAKFFFSIFGKIATALALITFAGVLRFPAQE